MDKTLEGSLKDIKDYIDGDGSHVTVERVLMRKAPEFNAKDIKKIRRQLSVTQRELAYILDISPKTVQSWETNHSKPNGSSRRLLQIIQKDPEIIKKVI